MAATGAPAMPSLDDTQGAMFIGTSIAGALFGVSCVQAYYYAMNYGSDPLHLKLLVAIVFVCDVLHQIMISHSVYTNVITNFGNAAALMDMPWSLVAEVEVTAIIALFVQGFYVFRVWRLSHKNIYLTLLVSILIIPAFVIQTVYTAKMAGTDLMGLVKLTPLAKAINALNAAADVLIAAVMVYLLRQGRTGIGASDSMINQLVLFVVNTGTLTSVCAISAFIALMARPSALIYAVFFFTTPRLYVNSLFATLNARQSIRAAHVGSNGEVISLRLAQNGSNNGANVTRATGPGAVTVNVEQTTTFDDADMKRSPNASFSVV